MADKEMSLMMRIRANGDAALRVLKQVDGSVRSLSDGLGTVSRTAGGVFSAVRGVGGALFAPLAMAAKAGGILAIGIGALGAKAMYSAANMETLKLRLEAVLGSADKAARVFSEVEKFAAATPFQLDELVEAKVLLEGIGVSGPDSLKNVADAAAAMGRSVVDTASMVASMETEPLRRMGITLKREGNLFMFEFQDKMGQMQKITKTSSEEARQALLGIFDVKAGGATAKLGESAKGIFSTLTDSINIAMGRFGKPMNDAAMPFVKKLTGLIDKISSSDAFEAFASRIGQELGKAMEHIQAFIMTIPAVWEAVKNTFANPETFATVFSSIGRIAATALVSYLEAAGAVFVGIGKMISAAFLDDILRYMPGTTNMRREMAGSSLATMSRKDYAAFAAKNDLQPGQELTKDQEIELAMMQRQAMFRSAIESFTKRLPEIGATAGGSIMEELRGLNTATGVDIGGTYRQNLESVRAQPKGKDSLVIQIENLNLWANDKQQLVERIKESAAVPAMSPAGT